MGNKNSMIQAYGNTVREERNSNIHKWATILERRKR